MTERVPPSLEVCSSDVFCAVTFVPLGKRAWPPIRFLCVQTVLSLGARGGFSGLSQQRPWGQRTGLTSSHSTMGGDVGMGVTPVKMSKHSCTC